MTRQRRNAVLQFFRDFKKACISNELFLLKAIQSDRDWIYYGGGHYLFKHKDHLELIYIHKVNEGYRLNKYTDFYKRIKGVKHDVIRTYPIEVLGDVIEKLEKDFFLSRMERI